MLHHHMLKSSRNESDGRLLTDPVLASTFIAGLKFPATGKGDAPKAAVSLSASSDPAGWSLGEHLEQPFQTRSSRPSTVTNVTVAEEDGDWLVILIAS